MNKLAVLILLAPAVCGCVTPRAQTPIERPTLDVPPVPPRVIDPAPPPAPPAIEPVSELPAERASPPPPKPRPSATRETKETPKPEPSKPDLPLVEPAPTTAPPAPPLRTAATADAAAAERRIRDILQRSQGMLKGIDYQRLRQELRAEYDRAKDHIDRAEVALKELNFDLAGDLADKAEKLARELQRR